MYCGKVYPFLPGKWTFTAITCKFRIVLIIISFSMKNDLICLLFAFVFCLFFPASAQILYDVTSNRPVQVNGLEYGYSVRNESTREVINLGTFKRYEITVYVTNKSGVTKLMPCRQTSFGVRNQDLLAHFDCLNATGAKLTSKTTAVRARPMPTPSVAASTTTADEKTLATALQPDHMLANGETITNNVIVLVPDGEQPKMRVRLQNREKPMN